MRDIPFCLSKKELNRGFPTPTQVNAVPTDLWYILMWELPRSRLLKLFHCGLNIELLEQRNWIQGLLWGTLTTSLESFSLFLCLSLSQCLIWSCSIVYKYIRSERHWQTYFSLRQRGELKLDRQYPRYWSTHWAKIYKVGGSMPTSYLMWS